MATLERRTLRINGIDTVLLEGGSGPTLVYFHGAGTVTGFDFANPWTKKFRVLIPYHPGFGASADDPAVTLEQFQTDRAGHPRLDGRHERVDRFACRREPPAVV